MFMSKGLPVSVLSHVPVHAKRSQTSELGPTPTLHASGTGKTEGNAHDDLRTSGSRPMEVAETGPVATSTSSPEAGLTAPHVSFHAMPLPTKAKGPTLTLSTSTHETPETIGKRRRLTKHPPCWLTTTLEVSTPLQPIRLILP